jgi:hypothetical protein
VVAPAPWHVQQWSVDADCVFYDLVSPKEPDQPISVHVPPVDAEESIATLQQFSPPATALLTHLTEARPLIRTELTVKTHDGGHQITGLVDCAIDLSTNPEMSCPPSKVSTVSSVRIKGRASVRSVNKAATCGENCFSVAMDSSKTSRSKRTGVGSSGVVVGA